MISLKEITQEYLGSLKYVQEIKREISIQASSDILAIIGPRRVGKTFLMLKRAKELIEKGEKALYVPFDEPSLKSMSVREFAELVRKEYPEGKVHLFLDEIQEWEGWDQKLRFLHDVHDFYLYVSGSSSAMLSSEIPSKLRGRYISKTILPLSFREISGEKAKDFRERGKILRTLEEYLKYGGFPEVWQTRSRDKVLTLLDTIFYRDVVERHKIREVEVFRDFFYYVVLNYGNPFTYNSFRKLLRNKGIEIDVKTLMKYFRYLEEAFLLFSLRPFSRSPRRRIVSPKKVYLVDPSFSMLSFSEMDFGRKMENAVFLELMRRKDQFTEIFYYDEGGKEVDFLVKRGPEVMALIEVTYSEEKIPEKASNLASAGKKLRCANLYLITYRAEEKLKEKGKEILAIPLWKFLLSSEDYVEMPKGEGGQK